MKSKKKHTNQDFEVVDGIGKYTKYVCIFIIFSCFLCAS